jgi:hypothetical protein
MLLAGGLVLDERAAVIDYMSGQSWSSYELGDVRSFRPMEDTAAMTYAVVAQRDVGGIRH